MTTALCHGAATVIAAFATGKGAALSLDLNTKAKVELNSSGKIRCSIKSSPKENTKLIELCVKNTMKHYGFKHGAVIETESNIPIAAGLKSSSVAANAAVLATAGALAEWHGEIRNVRLSKSEKRQELVLKGRVVDSLELVKIGVESALQAKVTVTGAFDDATASFLGGYTVTDNRERKILRSGDLESLSAVIFLPEGKKVYTTKVDLTNISLIKNSVQAAWEMAMKGEIYTALTINGFLHSIALNYNPEIQLEALKAGAIAAGLSGKGPAVVALTRGNSGKIKKVWKKFKGKIIECETNNAPAIIIR